MLNSDRKWPTGSMNSSTNKHICVHMLLISAAFAEAFVFRFFEMIGHFRIAFCFLLLLSQIESSCTTFLINWKRVWFAWNEPTHETLSRQWFCKKTRFDIQSKVNSQMAFYSIPPSYAYGPLQRPSCLCQPCLCNFQRTTIVLALFNVLSVLC